MKKLLLGAFILSSTTVHAGDAEKGEKGFNKCKSCHTIQSDAGDMIVKGGKTGPNLYGVIGRAAGSTDFKYSKSMQAAGAAGLVWSEEAVAEFVQDPTAYLKANGGDGRSKMSFKLKKGGEDIAAYLASVAQ